MHFTTPHLPLCHTCATLTRVSIAAKQVAIRPYIQDLTTLATALELSQDDLGRMFAVSGETIRRWRNGSAIPLEARAKIAEALAGLERLQRIFLPESLAPATRRKAQAFDGDSAFDWILRGRIRDVADIYEFVLSYQG